mmetsp:Transcript_134/g.224  ORF Transcript_134/g.224 Transcript_134/m.224 type:complete len:243 (-) Transcript_134:3118-3846(-)
MGSCSDDEMDERPSLNNLRSIEDDVLSLMETGAAAFVELAKIEVERMGEFERLSERFLSDLGRIQRELRKEIRRMGPDVPVDGGNVPNVMDAEASLQRTDVVLRMVEEARQLALACLQNESGRNGVSDGVSRDDGEGHYRDAGRFQGGSRDHGEGENRHGVHDMLRRMHNVSHHHAGNEHSMLPTGSMGSVHGLNDPDGPFHGDHLGGGGSAAFSPATPYRSRYPSGMSRGQSSGLDLGKML